MNPTEVFRAALVGTSDYRCLEPVSFTGWSTLLLVDQLANPTRRVAKGLFGYNSVLRAVPAELRGELYGYYWYRQLPDSAHEYMANQFRQEIEILRLLDGTGVAPVIHDVDVDAPIPYYVMEHLPFGSVRDWRRTSALEPGEILRFAGDLLSRINTLHDLGFVHRDINAENVLVSEQGPVLADFGCARRIAGDEPAAPKSPILHWPPEYDGSYHLATPKSDLYCFGMVMYELLTGTLPRYGSPPLDALVEAQDERLVDLIECCVSWHPEKRPENATECLDHLAAASTLD
jgi:serine/threonine protein kinase